LLTGIERSVIVWLKWRGCTGERPEKCWMWRMEWS
jgi:hypothetical protein